MKIRHSLKKQIGFTLIELIIVIMILGIIAGIGSKILSQAFLGYFDNKYLVESDWQARLALERMQRDIRAIRSTADISTATATQLAFIDTNSDTITYSLSSAKLYRQTNSNTAQVLADGIQSITFSYFDKNGTTTAVAANIRYITISLNVTLNNTNYIINTSVYGRNLS
jgi:prepilin-type N-terminal cleavage/methylation domain-containing protein